MSRKASSSSLLAVLLCTSSLEAHALKADVRVHKDKITVEAYFEQRGTPAGQAQVKVIDRNDKVVAEGRTNVEGFCSLALPLAGDYQLVVDAGAGHRTSKKIVVPIADQRATGAAPATRDPTDEADSYPGFDSSRWLKIVIGLCAIAVLGIGFVLSRRLSARTPGNSGADA